jgi:hypothetical protein
MLDNGSLLALCVDEVWLWGHHIILDTGEINDIKGQNYGHYVLVTGYKGNSFRILDPYPTSLEGRHGLYEVDGETILNANLIFCATILEVLR